MEVKSRRQTNIKFFLLFCFILKSKLSKLESEEKIQILSNQNKNSRQTSENEKNIDNLEQKNQKMKEKTKKDIQKDLFFWRESLQIELNNTVNNICGISFSGDLMIDRNKLVSTIREIPGIFGSWNFFENDGEVVYDKTSQCRHMLRYEINKNLKVELTQKNSYNNLAIYHGPDEDIFRKNKILSQDKMENIQKDILETQNKNKENNFRNNNENKSLDKEKKDFANSNQDSLKKPNFYDEIVATEFYDRFYYLASDNDFNMYPLTIAFEVMVIERNENSDEEFFCPIMLKGFDDFEKKEFQRSPGKQFNLFKYFQILLIIFNKK